MSSFVIFHLVLCIFIHSFAVLALALIYPIRPFSIFQTDGAYAALGAAIHNLSNHVTASEIGEHTLQPPWATPQ